MPVSSQGWDLEFDFVVVGGGSAGCVVAARLSEDETASICVVEAGGRDRNLWIHIPVGFGRLVSNPDLNWGFETEPERELRDRRIPWPRGKVLGGSGSINGLVFLRGFPTDYDEWERLGATGWNYRDVLPYFRKCEHNVAGVDDWRSQNGPLTISDIKSPSLPARAFVEACSHLQYQRNCDFNGERADGVGFVQLNVRNGWRCSPAVGYLRPNIKRCNLELMTMTNVRKILFEGQVAVGVEAERGGKTICIRARREVILCAGAIGSPQLLLMSGVGPPEELLEAGVTVQHKLAGVGKNLQDHFLTLLAFRTNIPNTLNEIVRNPLLSMKAMLNWLVRGSGPFAVGGTEATLFARSRPTEAVPDLQFQCVNFSLDSFEEGLHPWPGFMISFYVCRPRSRGEIKLRDPIGRLPPRIYANYLSHPDDWRIMLDGYRLSRRIVATEPINSMVLSHIRPNADYVTDEQFVDHVRDYGSSVFHPCGTNRMGTDQQAVVDPQLRVHGLARLRVVDASVMPTMPSCNIHPATIMIAEKGSDLLASAW